MTRDYRDGVIEQFAYDEAILLERVATLESEVRAYRELAQEAIHALARATKERHDARRALFARRDAERKRQQQAA